MRYKRTILTVVVMTLTTFAWALKKVTFAPQWTAQAQFAGYFVAKDMGFYAEEGLDVNIIYPSNSQSSIELLKEGRCQFTTLQLLDALCAKEYGINLVNLLQTDQQSGLVLVGYDGRNPAELKQGAKVGIWNAGFSILGRIINQREKKNYQFIRFTNNVSLFMSGAIDATLAMSYNELLQLRQSNVNLDGKTVFWFSKNGYDVPEDGLYTTRKYYTKNSQVCKSFAKASKRGWEWCRQHPDEALEIVMKYVKENKILTNQVIQRLMLQEILRLHTDPVTGKTLYTLDKAKVEKAIGWLLECGIIKNQIHYKDITE